MVDTSIFSFEMAKSVGLVMLGLALIVNIWIGGGVEVSLALTAALGGATLYEQRQTKEIKTIQLNNHYKEMNKKDGREG